MCTLRRVCKASTAVQSKRRAEMTAFMDRRAGMEDIQDDGPSGCSCAYCSLLSVLLTFEDCLLILCSIHQTQFNL